jgi:hypothetical protein
MKPTSHTMPFSNRRKNAPIRFMAAKLVNNHQIEQLF